MSKIKDRKVQVLKFIVEEYIKTGEVMWSKSLLARYNLGVSSATVRNDMASLEEMGLIFQPYNSAGRLPTNRGLRVFVDYLMETMPAVFLEASQQRDVPPQQTRIDDTIHGLITRLSETTGEIAFAAIPSLSVSASIGLSSYLERHHGILGEEMFPVIKILEDKYGFLRLLESLTITGRVSIFIGDENIAPELRLSTMIVKKIEINGYAGYLGILGSTMMDYPFNIMALRQVL